MSAAIELSEVQRIIAYGVRLLRVRHYLLRIVQPDQAREFLKNSARHVPSADQKCDTCAVAVALTYNGMRALQLPDEYLNPFRRLAPAFVEGAAARAAAHLRDTGRNESPRWELPFRSPETHVLLTLHADEESQLDQAAEQLHGGNTIATGLSGWNAPLSGRHIGDKNAPRTENFGFRDGISQPTIQGVHVNWEQRNPPSMHAEPGEFLLGHRDEDAADRWSAPDLSLPVREFIRNGSFMALRKMRQHLQAFQAVSPLQQAKMCGRWPNGALLRQGETAQPAAAPAQDQINQFDFRHDAHGRGCPFGSHIRRLNPRSDSVIPPRKRLLMRRGTPYAVDQADGSKEVGLLGLFVCADLERQFEFLLNDWTREPPMLPGSNSPDPLLDFVTTRGTLYGFYPSRRALGMIGTLS